MNGFDYVKMGATGRQLQDIMTSRLAEHGAKISHRDMEAIMLMCVEMASIAHGEGDARQHWKSIAFMAARMGNV